jgi:hypothetical protein
VLLESPRPIRSSRLLSYLRTQTEGDTLTYDKKLAALADKFGPKHANRKPMLVVSPDNNGMNKPRPIAGQVDWAKQKKLDAYVGAANVQAGVPTRGEAVAGAGRRKNGKR